MWGSQGYRRHTVRFGFRSQVRVNPYISFDTRASWVKFKDDDLNIIPIEATVMLKLGMVYAGAAAVTTSSTPTTTWISTTISAGTPWRNRRSRGAGGTLWRGEVVGAIDGRARHRRRGTGERQQHSDHPQGQRPRVQHRCDVRAEDLAATTGFSPALLRLPARVLSLHCFVRERVTETPLLIASYRIMLLSRGPGTHVFDGGPSKRWSSLPCCSSRRGRCQHARACDRCAGRIESRQEQR